MKQTQLLPQSAWLGGTGAKGRKVTHNPLRLMTFLPAYGAEKGEMLTNEDPLFFKNFVFTAS